VQRLNLNSQNLERKTAASRENEEQKNCDSMKAIEKSIKSISREFLAWIDTFFLWRNPLWSAGLFSGEALMHVGAQLPANHPQQYCMKIFF
jgi:hypothetical protein